MMSVSPQNNDLHTSYFQVSDEQQGGLLSRHWVRKVAFSAADFEEFSRKFQQMSDEIISWRKQYKNKAKVLEVAINAHPWILKRVRQQFYIPYGEGHGYGDFCQYGTVKLHLFDPMDMQGEHSVVYEKGKKQA